MPEKLNRLIRYILVISVVLFGAVTITACDGDDNTSEESKPVYLAFTGDLHGEIDTYRSWIEDLQVTLGDTFVYLCEAGDICDKSWEAGVFTEFKTALDETMGVGNYAVTTGNQEWKSGSPAADGKWEKQGEGFIRVGVAKETDDYIVFNFGAPSQSQIFADEDIATLQEFLDTAPADIPIFIVGHYPLHLFVKEDIAGGGYRESENADKVVKALNDHENTIFVWGHTHSFGDPRYGTIRFSGTSITYDNENPTEKLTLNFSYANFGSFCRGDTYGLFAGIKRTDAGVEVSLAYFDETTPDTEYDSATLLYSADGTVTGTLTAGDSIDEDEILLYSGYPDDLDFVSAYE